MRSPGFVSFAVLFAAFVPNAGAQSSALDGLNQLVRGLSADQRSAEALIRLSRMLPEPAAQLDWLVEQLEAQPEGDPRQTLLAQVEARLRKLRAVGGGEWASNFEARLASFRPRTPEPVPVPEPSPTPTPAPGNLIAILNPTEFVAAWNAGGGLDGLSDTQKFQLTARGAPVLKFRSSKGRMGAPPWDLPRVILDDFSSGKVETAESLLRLRKQIRARMSDPSSELKRAYETLSGLVDRALGVNPSGDWAALAAGFSREGSWLWAALANWLASDNAGVQEAWDRYAAVGNSIGGGVGAQPWGQIGPVVAANDGGQRAAAAQAAASRNVEATFRAMQQAKMTEAGVSGAALGLEELKAKLIPQSVDLFVEMLMTPDGNWIAVIVYPEKNDNSAADPFLHAIVGPTSLRSLGDEIARAPLNNASDPLILIASDGPPPAEWFPGERALYDKLKGKPEGGRIAYLPSASGLNPDVWTLDVTLRAWYQIGMRRGDGPIDKSGSNFRAPLPGRFTLHYISWNESPSSATGQLNEVMDKKLIKRVPELSNLIPLIVSR